MNNYKRIFMILLVNIIIVIGIFFLLNWIIYKYFYYDLERAPLHVRNEHRPYTLKRKYMDYETSKKYYGIRKPSGLEYNKNAIIMFGCSYGYGALLSSTQEPGYKLSEKLKRPVYNFSSSGQSPQFPIMRIRSHEIDDIIKKSDYVIYVLIGEHVWRIHTNSNGFPIQFVWPKYDVKKTKNNTQLILHKSYLPVIEGSYLYKFIQKKWYAKILTRSKNKYIQDYMFDNLKLHLLTIQKEMQQINPNIKMIVISFHDEPDTDLITHSPRWKELEKENIMFVEVEDYIKDIERKWDQYHIPNDGHPNERCWTEITNLITDKLKLLK